MARGFWTGAIRLGLVNIPVTMLPASESVDLDFDLVDQRDFSPVGYRKVNKNTGRDVPRERIVKVFRIPNGEAVVVTDEDFARARSKGTRNLDLLGFLPLDRIPPVYFDTPYFLDPAGKDAHAYVLLRDILRESKKAALAKGVLRTRERLGALFVQDGGLLFNTLRFEHEFRKRPSSELVAAAAPPTKAELDMGRKLIEGMEIDWEPQTYRDEYHEELVAYIRKKAKAGKSRKVFEAVGEEPLPAAPSGIDLMQLLKESLRSPGRRRPRSAS